MFTSDNERGIAALAGDMSGMGVEVIIVGPGQHDHTIELMIRQLEGTIRATKYSLPILVQDYFMMTIMIVLCGYKLNLLPSTATRTDNITTSCCTILYCTVVYCTVLYYTVCSTVLYCTVLHYTALFYTVMFYTIL